MKLLSVAVSNVRSFGYDEGFSERIRFDTGTSPLHILIGPNGSGKSNLIEILNQIFTKEFFAKYSLNQQNQDKKNYIQREQVQIKHLEKNWYTDDNQHLQRIQLELKAEDIDRKNINFLREKQGELKEIIRQYSNVSEQDLLQIFEGSIPAGTETINMSVEKIAVSGDAQFRFHIDENTAFISYLRHYEFFNCIINLRNSLYSKTEGVAPWEPLKITFIMEGTNRNYETDLGLYSLGQSQSEDQTRQQSYRNSTKETSTTASAGNNFGNSLSMLLHKVSIIGEEAMKEKGVANQKEKINDYLKDSKFVKNLKELLQVDFEFVGADRLTYEYKLKRDNKLLQPKSLSSGERSILGLILMAESFEVNEGLLIIDEPELHMHPQMQAKYRDILMEFASQNNLQIIIATHSPIFINERTISGVKRLYYDKELSRSRVTLPIRVDSTQKDLISFLDYTNTSSIFFADKVIMVEGKSDEYFFRAFLKKEFPKANVEVLDIKGKKAIDKWNKFLKLWQIEANYIGDYDNVLDFRIASSDDYQKKKKTLDEVRRSVTKLVDAFDIKDEKEVKKIIEDELRVLDLPATSPENLLEVDKKKIIEDKIDKSKKEHIYILKRGDLELYLGTSKNNKVGTVIAFCANGFNFPSKQYEREIRDILREIVE